MTRVKNSVNGKRRYPFSWEQHKAKNKCGNEKHIKLKKD